MSTIYIGSARHDENGKYANGKLGDSLQTSNTFDTKGEVSMQPMYTHSKGWYILRAKSIDKANKLAECMTTLCNNGNIGYDQANRLAIIKDGINSKVPTECDCSSAVRCCIISAGMKDPGNFTTADEVSRIKTTDDFEQRIAYINQTKTPVYNGDILVTKTKGHTVIVVKGNPRTSTVEVEVPKTTNATSIFFPKYEGDSKSIVDALKSLGVKQPDIEYRKKVAIANNIPITNSIVMNEKLLALLKKGILIQV